MEQDNDNVTRSYISAGGITWGWVQVVVPLYSGFWVCDSVTIKDRESAEEEGRKSAEKDYRKEEERKREEEERKHERRAQLAILLAVVNFSASLGQCLSQNFRSLCTCSKIISSRIVMN
jgi:hypothetical protein